MIMRMPRSRLPVLLLLITGSVFHLTAAHAATVQINSKNPPQIKLKVEKGGHGISVVDFDVPAGQVGNSQPIVGDKEIDIDIEIRATPVGSRMATLTVDSSSPLSNGSTTLLMSNISWTSATNVIPAGTFNNTTNQFLMSHSNSVQISDKHIFSYKNTQIL